MNIVRTKARPHGYVVRVTAGKVVVEHRAAFQPATLVVLCAVYGLYCVISPVRETSVNFMRTRDPVFAAFVLLFVMLPWASALTWLLFASGEVMRCDRRELHFAKRRTWGRWKRYRFDTAEIKHLHSAWRGGPKRRNYTVLSFVSDGQRYDLLEDLPAEESRDVLEACRAFGVDAVSARVLPDPAVVMKADIAMRGWWVNPWGKD